MTQLTLQLSINPAAPRHPISPLIYGINAIGMNDQHFAELSQAIKPPVVRWGGNATSRYNWQNDFYNTGKDWYYENIPYDNPKRSELPNNSAADRFIQRNKDAGIESLITVPLIGWVAKAKAENDPNLLDHPYNCGFKVSKYGEQQSTDKFDPDCGNGIRPDSSLVVYNYPADTSIAVSPDFVNCWVRHLVGKFGDASEGGVRFYALDNEPGIWFETHRDVFPGYLSYEELLQRSIDYAAAIRQADPNAQILGPVQDGWMRYFYSSYGSYPDETAEKDRDAHKGKAFVAWYLAKLYERDQESRQRTIDYFCLHYYPEAAGVALSSDGGYTTNPLVVWARRLRSTRSLWDTSYVDESWIKDTEDGNTAVYLIPRMHAWVNKYYPGLKLAISEYNWGALDGMNGALAQADVLGIFGREDVGLATLWQPPTADQPGAFAFRMYQNYDGQGGKFGDISILATSADQGQLAIYAAERSSDRALTVMIINKSDNDLSAQIDLGGFIGGESAQYYHYSAATKLLSIAKLTDLPISNGAINSTFAARSINLLIIAGSI
ncbi:glycoside hydrolase family 44 protein [Cylindrospermum sp. FACHB-282]|uniref:glycoside hydrolase family 44 protein n=1 Tax=Cylindrospermum sp. FACHB-282 TaxID=2692794 RepID=UPI0016821745|nr:glycoside hydrolase family 44 protein [Cylindrospermum sp. FACHB-282]MBD2388369.1 glycoside hydrolase family 44 protein [Cylindrospermum sp. FACHB-282]